jgi:molybdate transport system substrate-binding protein
LLCAALVACESHAPSEAVEPAAHSAAPAQGQLVVFAASSLRDAFGAMADDFHATHPGVEITFNFAGTQELRTQVEQGAKADVFAAADQKHMAELVRQKLASKPLPFARNEPVIVVARESIGRIKSIEDLPNASRIVLGTPEVPIGRYAEQILELASAQLGPDFRARVEAKVVSRELNVKQVLAKVSLGEAQACIVYRTDARGVKDVTTLEIPSRMNVIGEYPIALLSGAPQPALARDWVELVLSDAGQARLHAAGFLSPAQVATAP